MVEAVVGSFRNIASAPMKIYLIRTNIQTRIYKRRLSLSLERIDSSVLRVSLGLSHLKSKMRRPKNGFCTKFKHGVMIFLGDSLVSITATTNHQALCFVFQETKQVTAPSKTSDIWTPTLTRIDFISPADSLVSCVSFMMNPDYWIYPFGRENDKGHHPRYPSLHQHTQTDSTAPPPSPFVLDDDRRMLVTGILIAIMVVLSLLLCYLVTPLLMEFLRAKIPESKARTERRYQTIEGWLVTKVRRFHFAKNDTSLTTSFVQHRGLVRIAMPVIA